MNNFKNYSIITAIQEFDVIKIIEFYKVSMLSKNMRSLKDYLTVYYGNNVQKVRCIKRKYDPENIFRFEQSIPPASEECALNLNL